MKQITTLFIVSLIGMVLTGCGLLIPPAITVLQQNPTFSNNSLYVNNIGILGVWRITNNGRYLRDKSNEEIVYKQLLGTVYSGNIASHTYPSNIVRKKLGDNDLSKLIKIIKMSNQEKKDSIHLINNKKLPFRYLIWLTLNNDKTSKMIDMDPADLSTVDRNKFYIDAVYHYKYTRSLAVSLAIFDIKLQKTVWEGVVPMSISNQKTYYDVYAATFLGDMAALTLLPNKKYPEPPTTTEVFKAAFAAFREKLYYNKNVSSKTTIDQDNITKLINNSAASRRGMSKLRINSKRSKLRGIYPPKRFKR